MRKSLRMFLLTSLICNLSWSTASLAQEAATKEKPAENAVPANQEASTAADGEAAKEEAAKDIYDEENIVRPAGQLDRIGKLQEDAALQNTAEWGHWGNRPKSYSAWTSHSNRLIPVYVFGASFAPYMNEGSLYRDEKKIEALYGRLPPKTHNPDAEYADQTDIYRLQKKAIEEMGKKYVFLVVFDGMDWQTTQAAAIYKSQKVYTEGVGSGLIFQDYKGVPLSYGWVVTAPYGDGVDTDVDAQLNTKPVTKFGGYDWQLGGTTPWAIERDGDYPIGRSKITPHAYTDSSSSATSLTAGVKSINGAVNLDGENNEVETVGRWAQKEKGFSIGVVTSVPISHATPSAAYSVNVSRDDYQDLTRDLLGLPSVFRKMNPHPGVDVLIGCGWGESSDKGTGQGANYVPGNRYLSDIDREKIDVTKGGKYVVAERTKGRSGVEVLKEGAAKAIESNDRFFGFFGAQNGHLPFQTANGDYITALSTGKKREVYSQAEISENPSLADMTEAALSILEKKENGFWMLVESGDVDWANHANNLDASIGAVLAGDKAISSIFNWIEAKDAWDESLVVITADHGHFFHLKDPNVLLEPK